MSKLFLLVLWIPLSAVFLPGQNLMPNPGFETHTTCPNSLGDVNGHVTSWTRANTATPDYANCGFNGNGAINFGPRTGSGSIGMWGGASHPSCASSAYSEAIQANLTSPMMAGQTYDVSIAMRVDGTGSATSSPNNCVDMGMYFYNSSSPPAANGWCCFNVTPQWSVAGGSIPQGTYQLFSGTITATGNFDRVLVGAFCNGNTNTGACGTYSTARMYFNLDDISAQPVVVLNEDALKLYGNTFTDFNALYWEFPESASFSQLTLERSSDGEQFETIHESNLLTGDHSYQYTDLSPFQGENHYRLTAIDANGQVYYSNLLRLDQGLDQTTGGGQLQYAYDQSSQILRFSLDTGLGGPFTLSVIDISGRILREFDWNMGPGTQDFEASTEGLAKGIYILRLQSISEGHIWQNKFMKL